MATLIDDRLKAKLFRGFAEISRLSILEFLREGPRNVSEIVEHVGLSQPNTSIHLECLYCCGLVQREKKGRFVYYSLATDQVEELLAFAERLLEGVGDHIRSCSKYED